MLARARRFRVVLTGALLLGAWAPSLAQGATLTRGPYLQQATPEGIAVRWRTDIATDSRVLCGPAPGALAVCAENPAAETEHIVQLESLSPDTRYYYAIGSTTEVLAGNDAEHFFHTSPPHGAVRPLRIWAIGDFGTAGAEQIAVRDAYVAHSGGEHTDLWLMLGDNAYSSGTDAEYQAAVFDIYPELLRQSVPWPTLGNHDGVSSSSQTETGPYYDIFTLPRNAEAGGTASMTEAYYSFDYANVHFVVLNSFDVPRTPGGDMLLWLEADLQDTDQDWIVAFWHHPPYSKGSHDSDLELPLQDMRQYAVPILEDHGADLVISGHSHSYERSFLIDGHHGDSTEFPACDDGGTPGDSSDDFCVGDPGTACPGGFADCDDDGMVLDAGDGRETGDGVYSKPLLGSDPHRGTVYTVSGSAGQLPGGGTLDHPAMFVSLNVLGSVVLEIDGDRLDATFIDDTVGVELDTFAIVKGTACPSGPYVDDDGDGVCNDLDICPDDPDPGQEDADADGAGDACDVCPNDADDDADADGACADVDNCPDSQNADQLDVDGDGSGDVCDPCPLDPLNDGDADGSCAQEDNCPDVANPGQEDLDVDGLGDVCDPCPADPLDDSDGDGLCAGDDNCPDDFNPCQIDSSGDGTGDVCAPFGPESCNVAVVADSYIKEDYTGSTNGSHGDMHCRSLPGGGRRPLVRFDLTGIAPGTALVSAHLWLFANQNDPSGAPVDVYRVTDSWDEGSASWSNTGADFDNAVRGSFVPVVDETGYTVDLTDLAQEWVDGVWPNHGVTLQSTSTGIESKFRSKEGPVAGESPCMQIVVQCLTQEQDSDGDGVPDATDGCPIDANKIEPGVCGCGIPDTDTDLDGALDCVDPCPGDPNDDVDQDGVCGDVDNCPDEPNSDQADSDADTAGDSCDACLLDPDDDLDADGICGDADNCPDLANPGQADSDHDGPGDACDVCAMDGDDDLDADGHCGDVDNCPATPNPGQEDADTDGIGDACQVAGDADGDTVVDGVDNCPGVPNPLQQDADADGAGDACDSDDDGDGVDDELDCEPLVGSVAGAPGPIGDTLRLAHGAAGTSLTWTRGVQGHVSNVYRGILVGGQVWAGNFDCVDFANPGTESTQTDGPAPGGPLFYYVVSAANACAESGLGPPSPGVAPRVASSGCPLGSRDSDGDGVIDAWDNCPLVANAGLSDVDLDFVGNECDNCPTVTNAGQSDADGDGRGDVCESLIDQDGDGIEDAADNCPALFNTLQIDFDMDGFGDVCDDCPEIYNPVQGSGELCAGFDNGYSYRRQVDFVNAQVAGQQTNFPVLLSTTLPDLRTAANGGNVENANGFDIVFASDEDGALPLAHELESYDAASGAIAVWVRVESLGVDTTIYMFYGNDGITTFQGDVASNGVTGVWGDTYKGVWHLNQATGATVLDSTPNSNHGTPESGPAIAVAGKISGALNFDVGEDATGVKIPASPSLDVTTFGNWTISAWIKPTDYSGVKWPTVYSYSVEATVGLSVLQGADGHIEHWRNDQNFLHSDNAATFDAWNHIAVVRDPTTTRFYLNGIDDGSGASVTISDAGQDSWIGGNSIYPIDDDFLGLIDEVRFSADARTGDWLMTEYNNQFSPSAFYVIGDEESRIPD